MNPLNLWPYAPFVKKFRITLRYRFFNVKLMAKAVMRGCFVCVFVCVWLQHHLRIDIRCVNI